MPLPTLMSSALRAPPFTSLRQAHRAYCYYPAHYERPVTNGATQRWFDTAFVTAGRKAFSANVMAQHFFWLFKNAGIDGASSHSMRRTFITNLATKGIGVRVLASLAGHRSIAVTQKYLDVNDDMKRNAVELV